MDVALHGSYEEFNCVPLIYKIDKGRPFRLAAKYAVTLDPTRRIEVRTYGRYSSCHAPIACSKCERTVKALIHAFATVRAA